MHFAKPCLLLFAFVASLAALAATPATAQESPGRAVQDGERTITSGGLKREFILHVPKNAAPGPKPVVIALHGALQPASIMQRYLDLDAVADREGFVVAYPKGMNLLWNDGRSTVAGFLPILYPRDDGRFVLDVLATLEAEGIADPNRAFLMGFSNGGFLTAFIACRYAEHFKAFATMMMTVPVGYNESCKPARPVPILIMNGTYDPIVPMFGRQTPGARLMSASESAELFARIDGCAPPQASTAPSARILRWDNCASGSAVAFYEIAGGHQPPAQSTGAGDALAAVILGPRRSGLDAPQEIWSFFKRFDVAPTEGAVMADAAAPGAPASGTVAIPLVTPGAAPVMATSVPGARSSAYSATASHANGGAPILRNPSSPANAWQGIASTDDDAAPAGARVALVPLPPPSPLRQRSTSAQ
ncbi:polyhydroxybutyrate depolymerase [Angulomicrobium tetraedrale]|uniref:Polyhydroxybutyrate depolymerase n=1 Tax=Ancylobacter tetraedralis TaxID=217068 RepID=A0A839Z2U9_9HYPH|nr:PHB depolymerase family esterase [Ancylobacter tetraedralis]MBB3771034.1 polyhydroxybutyrate depolymerase [Ancylobacter tetraedralis]